MLCILIADLIKLKKNIAHWKNRDRFCEIFESMKGFFRQKFEKHWSNTCILKNNFFLITNLCITHVSNAGNWCRKKFVVGLALVLQAMCHSWYKKRSQKFKITSFKEKCWEVVCYSVLVHAVHYSLLCLVSELNVLITFTRPNTNNFNLT